MLQTAIFTSLEPTPVMLWINEFIQNLADPTSVIAVDLHVTPIPISPTGVTYTVIIKYKI